LTVASKVAVLAALSVTVTLKTADVIPTGIVPEKRVVADVGSCAVINVLPLILAHE